eukprot:TRINITY_DN2854_c0_g1_i1.p3 TRINITY_DN2854_c0_g1~~TRINITY_DN2854_c0_g1_i1.p3  ORF type:complete len:203 (+),score=-13.11 TRINITY_DN2854_c0_g1_i1:658-1266(+)
MFPVCRFNNCQLIKYTYFFYFFCLDFVCVNFQFVATILNNFRYSIVKHVNIMLFQYFQVIQLQFLYGISYVYFGVNKQQNCIQKISKQTLSYLIQGILFAKRVFITLYELVEQSLNLYPQHQIECLLLRQVTVIQHYAANLTQLSQNYLFSYYTMNILNILEIIRKFIKSFILVVEILFEAYIIDKHPTLLFVNFVNRNIFF